MFGFCRQQRPCRVPPDRRTALDAGINLIDTADMYSDGESEEILGELMGGVRGEIIPATKFHFAMGEGPNRSGNSRRWIVRALDDSLRRLQTDWIDLYQVHRPVRAPISRRP